jgi:hypothetical protein
MDDWDLGGRWSGRGVKGHHAWWEWVLCPCWQPLLQLELGRLLAAKLGAAKMFGRGRAAVVLPPREDLRCGCAHFNALRSIGCSVPQLCKIGESC